MSNEYLLDDKKFSTYRSPNKRTKCMGFLQKTNGIFLTPRRNRFQ